MKTGCSTITRQTGQLCASFMVHLVYTGLRPYLETRSDCVFMFGICCVIAVSLFLYYTEIDYK